MSRDFGDRDKEQEYLDNISAEGEALNEIKVKEEERFHRDKLLLGLKSRYCSLCNTSRIHSEDGTFCLSCGRTNYSRNTFKVVSE